LNYPHPLLEISLVTHYLVRSPLTFEYATPLYDPSDTIGLISGMFKKIHFVKIIRGIWLADPIKYSIIPMRGRTVARIRALVDTDTACLMMVALTDEMRVTINTVKGGI